MLSLLSETLLLRMKKRLVLRREKGEEAGSKKRELPKFNEGRGEFGRREKEETKNIINIPEKEKLFLFHWGKEKLLNIEGGI